MTEAQSEPGPETSDGPLERLTDGWVVGTIFILALVLRIIHLSQIAQNDPFYSLGGVDGALYDSWARQIATERSLGDHVIFLGPLYPLFMAILYALFGEGLPLLKAVQAVVGTLTCVAVWALAREAFGRTVAAVAGLMMAVYGMHIFYGGTVMIVNLQAPLVVTVVWLALRARKHPKPWSWALCGLILGLSLLARQTTLLLAPLLVLWILFDLQPKQTLGRRLISAVTFVLPIAALILPFTLHNYKVGQDFVLVNSTGGYSFYMGNRQGTDGTWQLPPLNWPGRIDNPVVMREAFSSVAERDLGRSLRPSEVSSYWLMRGLEEIRRDPFEWIQLELRKAGLFLNAYEVWNNRSFEISRQFSWILRLPLVSFGFIAPLALLGIALNLRRVLLLFPLFAGLAAYFVSALMVFVLSRYRFPGTALMIPFAAFALVDLLNRALRSEWKGLATRFIALFVLSIFVYWPLTSEKRLHMAWYNLGNRFRALERYEEAINAYHESLQISSGFISTHNNLALALEGSGDLAKAIQSWSRVRQLAVMQGNTRYIERADRHLSALHSAETTR
ncbi:MAG: hypothetical protein CBC48_03555 [bacterium TMED88]|nr:hypothetical protein [Deltaproteobacteria bacterium]OUV35653.1 MAG: hypothetical protein CBC48_03555 [bacterium TMED88]